MQAQIFPKIDTPIPKFLREREGLGEGR